ncbi:MAG: radical SAM protein [Planctomycetes bacterium]|nr:radical SAM protein [Planctomycetota bacterium]
MGELMYEQFGITLMLTHACNLRCTYCYTGAKIEKVMPLSIGRRSIDRAIASLSPGGTLDLGFFGGEPLLQAGMISTLSAYAHQHTQTRGLRLSLALTTNGTVTGPDAWAVMMMPNLDLSISCDGLPDVHDRHRVTSCGRRTSQRVASTIRRLVAGSREFRVVVVVRPDTLEFLADGIEYLRSLGVDCIQPSLDLWTRWNKNDVARLEKMIDRCADLWRRSLPDLSVSWFDTKAGMLTDAPTGKSSRCGFGQGEIAVAPSGRLYPCERLIGEDDPTSPMALDGNALEGADFLTGSTTPGRSHTACDGCSINAECDTVCRCSNYVRTGNVSTPDGLLCALNQACMTATANVLNKPVQLSIQLGNQGASP